MSVTPMDLQVLFMQEGRAAKSADRAKNFAETMRTVRAYRKKYASGRENVKQIDDARSKNIDEEGSQGGATGYFAHRRQQEPELQEEEEERKDLEPELGKMMDLKI